MRKKEFTRKLLKIKYFLLVQVLVLTSCDFVKKKSKEDVDKVIASVGPTTLKQSEILFLINPLSSAEDSAATVSRYVQSWIRQQLMLVEASKAINFNTSEFNRKIREYKESLMIHEFEKDYLNTHLNQDISEDEVVNYYEQFKENFILKEIIVRANFVKLDKNNSQRQMFERALRDNNKEQLNDLSLKFASNYYLEDSNWIIFDELTASTPLEGDANNVQLLKNNSFIKTEDENYLYYFNILEYKLQNQVSPVEFVGEEIKKILLNKRMNSLREQLHKDIFTRALENKEFSIYE